MLAHLCGFRAANNYNEQHIFCDMYAHAIHVSQSLNRRSIDINIRHGLLAI